MPVAPGMPTKSAPAAPGLAHARIALQAPAATLARGATAATWSRNATKTESALARTNRPLRAASIPSAGLVAKISPPAGGSVAIAAQGIDTSSASGAPDTRGAVILPTSPPGPTPCGQRMVAVVCRTGRSGVSAHSATPRTPARIATRRAIRLDCALSLDTKVDGRRRAGGSRRERTQSVTMWRRVEGFVRRLADPAGPRCRVGALGRSERRRTPQSAARRCSEV